LLGVPLASLLLGPSSDSVTSGTPAGGPAGSRVLLLASLQSGNSARSDDAVITRSDQTRLPIACSLSPIVTGGEVVGAVFAFHDITERKAQTAALEYQAL